MRQSLLPALISYKSEVYRPAGYRVPLFGEIYVARDGHVKKCQATHTSVRLILRILNMDIDFKKKPQNAPNPIPKT